MLLDSGIDEITAILSGAGGTVWDSSNAYIAIGDDDTTESGDQTGMINEIGREPVDSVSNPNDNEIEYEVTFEDGEAEGDWLEWGVVNADSDGVFLNREQEDNGTKVSGHVWTFTVNITFNYS